MSVSIKPKFVLLLGASLLLGACNTVREAPPQRLNAEQVRQLFADQTVESVNLAKRRTSFTYYHPDGRVLQQRLWSYRTGTWEVRDNGKICLDFGKRRCRYIEQREQNLYKVRKSGGELQRLVRYRRFAGGNQLLAAGEAWPKGKRFTP